MVFHIFGISSLGVKVFGILTIDFGVGWGGFQQRSLQNNYHTSAKFSMEISMV